MKNNIIKIENYLDELYSNPICELNYKKDYELLIAVMLSAQSTDKRVNQVTSVLFSEYDSLDKLKNADINRIKEIIKSVGTFNRKAEYIKEISTILVDKYNSIMPKEREILESLPGVGRKSTNVVLSTIYNIPAIAVDTHVERVSKRLNLANKDDNVRAVEEKLMKQIKKVNWSKVHHQMVLFGRYKCKAVKPICEGCKLKEICNYSKK